MPDFVDFEARLTARAAETTAFLAKILGSEAVSGEIERPARLVEAMRYAVLNGGKRLRPFLLLETASMFGVTGSEPLRAAAALECVHCYSLVHDDLPAMDDDDMRRGKPTVHRAFDEATAILAGDSLLTLAFDLIADGDQPTSEIRAQLVVMLARAAGFGGMAGGQALDLEGENQALHVGRISIMQAMKTGALIRFACEAGAVVGGADIAERQAAIRYGKAIGEAFQLTDDILDVTASSEALGKKTGKDGARGKQTLVTLLGLDESHERARALIDEALAALAPFGARAALLSAAARYVLERSH